MISFKSVAAAGIVLGIAATMSAGAMAGSGQVVTKIASGFAENPHCVAFTTTGDVRVYGVSESDPGYEQTMISINNSRNVGGPVTFIVGNPGENFHAADCAAADVLYVYNVGR